jgi:hypothetical protein
MKFPSLLAIASGISALALSPAATPAWDVFSDTWAATDGLGRTLPLAAETGPPRADRTVALFYFLWSGRHGEAGPFDISRILAADPAARNDPAHPAWGPLGVPHHWGESIFSYYVADDDHVLRKHAQMLGDAGVDVIVFDVTNQFTYPESWRALGRVFTEVRAAGNRTPQFAFLCPFGDPAKVVRELYHELYQPGLFRDLWFLWDGKPLILADPERLGKPTASGTAPEPDPVPGFFTFRKPQPDYFQGPTGPNQWGWLEVTPQHAFHDAAGKPEQATVGVAQNALDGKLSALSNPRSHGRSFRAGREPGPDGYSPAGLNFAEQWQRARELDPRVLFITGWNEWIAGRFDESSPFHGDGPVTFVDQFNQEFSRDIEPMRGGHGDAYFYQMIDGIRRYKGTRPLPPVTSAAIQLDGSFDDWRAVTPEFRDTIGDPVKRDYRGWGKGTRHVETSGRHDLVAAKVSATSDTLYFHVRATDDLGGPAQERWLWLFLDTDGDSTNGWLGFDYLIGRASADGRRSLEKSAGTGFGWTAAGEVPFACHGRELECGIPRAALGLPPGPVTLRFKWADHLDGTGEWSDFTLHGDAAPNDRFTYQAVIP